MESGPCPSANVASTDKKGDGLVVTLAQKRDQDGRRRRVYGGSVREWECVNTARDLESRTCPSNSRPTLRVFVSVILTASSLCVPLAAKKVVAAPFRSRLLSYRQGLLCASHRRGRRMSVW